MDANIGGMSPKTLNDYDSLDTGENEVDHPAGNRSVPRPVQGPLSELNARPSSPHQQWRAPAASGLVSPTSSEKRSGPVQRLTEESHDFRPIAVDAARNFHKWMRENHSLLASEGDGLSEKVVRWGFLFDSVHRARFDSTWGAHSSQQVPEDSVFQSLYAEAYGEYPKEFSPRARETIGLLLNSHELANVKPEHRGRLIPDRIDLDCLGLDAANPLLCFVYDYDTRNYAHSTAKGLVHTAKCIDTGKIFDADLILDISEKMELSLATKDVHCTGSYDAKALRYLGKWMDDMSSFGISSSLSLPGHYINRTPEETYVSEEGGLSVQSVLDAADRAHPVKMTAEEYINSKVLTRIDRKERHEATFSRWDASEEQLMACMDGIADRYYDSMPNISSSADKRQSAWAASFQGIHLHPMKDGNCRLFFKNVLDLLLAFQGEARCVIADPHKAIAPEDADSTVLEGQAWRKALSS
ncbi:hypothetical protein [Burkholderia stabilis]|nr:hypothetical protein [Burkholderia stabilis]